MKILADNKIGASVASATAGTGVAEWLNWIPNDIGKLATVVGIALSLVLIGTHLWRAVLGYQKHRLEIEEIRRRNGETPDPGGDGD